MDLVAGNAGKGGALSGHNELSGRRNDHGDRVVGLGGDAVGQALGTAQVRPGHTSGLAAVAQYRVEDV